MTAVALIILAAGMGTRMKSALPKVLHKIGGRSLLGHVLTSGAELQPERTVVVIGPDMDDVAAEARRFAPGVHIAQQNERKGTAHAVSMAREALGGFNGQILILYGDCPLVRTQALKDLLSRKRDGQPASVLAFRALNPKGYGRLLTEGQNVIAIREELDASSDERLIDLCNSGILAVEAQSLWRLLPQIGNQNAKGEFYLTDLIALAARDGSNVGFSVCDEAEVEGVNDRVQLAKLEGRFQERCRGAVMLGGASLIDPNTVYFSADTILGRDVTIEPNVVFGPGVTVADDVVILAHCHIEGAVIGKGARIGPFARLRPGAVIGAYCHVGNYVEIKQADIGQEAKINHLSYVGDAEVGPRTNIGAGTITCNYDGFEKHRTVIGTEVFVGSNTALVAPVSIGDRANIAAGSVITQKVPDDALAISRAAQDTRLGWAVRYRELKRAQKASRQS